MLYFLTVRGQCLCSPCFATSHAESGTYVRIVLAEEQG